MQSMNYDILYVSTQPVYNFPPSVKPASTGPATQSYLSTWLRISLTGFYLHVQILLSTNVCTFYRNKMFNCNVSISVLFIHYTTSSAGNHIILLKQDRKEQSVSLLYIIFLWHFHLVDQIKTAHQNRI